MLGNKFIVMVVKVFISLRFKHNKTLVYSCTYSVVCVDTKIPQNFLLTFTRTLSMVLLLYFTDRRGPLSEDIRLQ